MSSQSNKSVHVFPCLEKIENLEGNKKNLDTVCQGYG